MTFTTAKHLCCSLNPKNVPHNVPAAPNSGRLAVESLPASTSSMTDLRATAETSPVLQQAHDIDADAAHTIPCNDPHQGETAPSAQQLIRRGRNHNPSEELIVAVQRLKDELQAALQDKSRYVTLYQDAKKHQETAIPPPVAVSLHWILNTLAEHYACPLYVAQLSKQDSSLTASSSQGVWKCCK